MWLSSFQSLLHFPFLFLKQCFRVTVSVINKGQRTEHRCRWGWRIGIMSVKSHQTVVNLKGGIVHAGPGGNLKVTSVLKWTGSRRGSSSCRWGRPRGQWGRDPPKLLQLWWGSACHLHPTGILQLRDKKKKKKNKWHLLLTDLFDHFLFVK